jgi:hypothetical protein
MADTRKQVLEQQFGSMPEGNKNVNVALPNSPQPKDQRKFGDAELQEAIDNSPDNIKFAKDMADAWNRVKSGKPIPGDILDVKIFSERAGRLGVSPNEISAMKKYVKENFNDYDPPWMHGK